MQTNPELEVVHNEARVCTRCVLSQTRKMGVPGDGPADSDLMFIGEAPGYWENERGVPFVGAAGHLLEDLLKTIGFDRSQVFITNVLKCRPPNNRDPLPDEIAACRPYLDQQLEIIRPKVIVTLGRHSSGRFFPPKAMRDMHGKPVPMGTAVVMATYHPAAILRQPNLRPIVDADFQLILEILKKAPDPTTLAPEPESRPPTQLDLFS